MAKKKEEKEGFEKTLNDLEQKYGMGKPSIGELIITSTGSIQLDRAMKIGGTALGKIIEIYGEESSGKSTIILHQIAEYQKAFPEKRVVLFDYEYSFDPTYAESIGVDMNKLLIYQPDNQELGYDMLLALISKELISCAVIDSQTAAAPKAIVNGEMSDSTISLQARNNSKFCLKVKGLLSIHKVALFIISQTRDNIGGMSTGKIPTGGNAFKFYADVRWKVWKMNDKDHELNKTTIDVIKSKVGKPFGQAKINILWGEGFDKIGEIIEYAEEFKIIKRGGAYYSYEGSIIGQGLEKTKAMLKDNPELLEEITKKVVDILNAVQSDVPVEEVNVGIGEIFDALSKQEFENQKENGEIDI
jgi:recombination protein RecA